ELLRQAPAPADRSHAPAVALAPEGLAERLADLGAGVEGLLPERVDVLCDEVEDGRGAPDRERREDVEVGELAGEHDHRLAERELDLQELAARDLDPAAFLGAEGGSIPVGGASRVLHDQVWSDRHDAPLSRLRHARVPT